MDDIPVPSSIASIAMSFSRSILFIIEYVVSRVSQKPVLKLARLA